MNFETLILGTGLAESIVSAALSKQGNNVGHLDEYPFYGRSHGLYHDCLVENSIKSGILPAKCTIEMSPKLVFANGLLTELLIDSKVGSYLEFRECQGIHVYLNGWKRLPESKEDVFLNSSLSLIEKRKLMKFITTTADAENSGNFDTFAEYLESFDLGDDLVAMILYGITLISGTREEIYNMSWVSGLAKAKLYLSSLGKFCKSGFLVASYGSGSELSQGFCRSSAVYGGTFILNTPIDKITKEQNGFKIYSQDQVFNCKRLIASTDFSEKYNDLQSTFSR